TPQYTSYHFCQSLVPIIHPALLTHHPHFFLSTTPPPPRSTLFPYTTLFRSALRVSDEREIAQLLLDILDLVPRRHGRRHLEKKRSEEHTSELQSLTNLVCRLLLEKKKNHSKQLSAFHRKSESCNDHYIQFTL